MFLSKGSARGGKDTHRKTARMRDWLRCSGSLFRACLFVPCGRDAFRARTTGFAIDGSAEPRHCREVRTVSP
jgi:hypothetical protein